MDWKGFGRKRSWSESGYYPCVFLEVVIETTKTCHDSRCPGCYSNWAPVKYSSRSTMKSSRLCHWVAGVQRCRVFFLSPWWDVEMINIAFVDVLQTFRVSETSDTISATTLLIAWVFSPNCWRENCRTCASLERWAQIARYLISLLKWFKPQS
jgi:hypothetical protein